MKKIKNTLILLTVCLVTFTNAQKIQKEQFTTIDDLFYIELGMTTSEVQTTLGVKPYDFYQNLAAGEMVVEYRYLHKRILIKSKDNNYLQSEGEDYYDIPSSIFMTFNKNSVLTSFFTNAGYMNSKDSYIWENTIKEYNLNPNCSKTCIIIPDTVDE